MTTLQETDKIYRKSFHNRNDSGELDVFEAARYFSGYNNEVQKILREDHSRQAWRGGRISLDFPMMRDSVLHQLPQKQNHNTIEKQIMKEHNKYKQPSSPGGRLASFLNSLFSQSRSKNKKKSKSTTQSMKDEEESPGGGRRKRRSSISHFRSSSTTTTTTTDSSSKSLYSSSSSGFRTPPPYLHTPRKCDEDFRSFSDHKQVMESLSRNNNIGGRGALEHHDKFKFNNTAAYSEKNKTRNWVDDLYSSEEKEKEFRKFNEVDEGAESDSSSDLFELQNYDLGIYSSSGLPVYETTRMDSIKRGAPISNGAL